MILGEVVERNAELYPEQTALFFVGRAINLRFSPCSPNLRPTACGRR